MVCSAFFGFFRFPAQPAALLRAASAGILLAALAGCVGPQHQYAPPVVEDAHLVAFKAVLSGRNAVPPATTHASGELVAVLDRNTDLLRWRLTYSQLSGPVRSAHFVGAAATPELSIGRSFRSPYEGRAVLTPDQRADLLAGQWYVNLRTARFPEGELRGRMIEQR